MFKYILAHGKNGKLIRTEFLVETIEEAMKYAQFYNGCIKVYDEQGNIIVDDDKQPESE
jgi:hypothetical protein